MSKLKIQTGEDNEVLRTLSSPIAQNEIKKYRATAEDMIKHIKNPDNGGV